MVSSTCKRVALWRDPEPGLEAHVRLALYLSIDGCVLADRDALKRSAAIGFRAWRQSRPLLARIALARPPVCYK